MHTAPVTLLSMIRRIFTKFYVSKSLRFEKTDGTGRTDGRADRQTDRQTDRVQQLLRPPGERRLIIVACQSLLTLCQHDSRQVSAMIHDRSAYVSAENEGQDACQNRTTVAAGV